MREHDQDDNSFDLEQIDESNAVPNGIEASQDSVYKPKILWQMNRGLNQAYLHKLYGLLADKSSSLHAHEVTAIHDSENTVKDAYVFKNAHNNNKIVLFKPDNEVLAIYSTQKLTQTDSFLDDKFYSYLKATKIYCLSQRTPIRFILPFDEMSNDLKGVKHSVLLVMDYDPNTKKLKPNIIDSIGRGNLADVIAKQAKGKDEATADNIIDESIQNIFNEKNDDRLTAEKIHRIAYNHQNRLIEGNCCSYTFRGIVHAIEAFSENKTIKQYTSEIPSSGIITSNSYLTSQQVKEIQDYINYKNITSSAIDKQMLNLNQDTSQNESTYNLDDFIASLQAYASIRKKEKEKPLFSLSRYTQEDKVNAAKLLAEVLEKRDFSQIQNILKQYKLPLEEGRLGELVTFHLKKINCPNLSSLNSHWTLDESNDDFEIIEDTDDYHALTNFIIKALIGYVNQQASSIFKTSFKEKKLMEIKSLLSQLDEFKATQVINKDSIDQLNQHIENLKDFFPIVNITKENLDELKKTLVDHLNHDEPIENSTSFTKK